MITAVTLNTSIDKAYQVEDVKKGTVMRVKSCNNTAGGKGLNGARVLQIAGKRYWPPVSAGAMPAPSWKRC